MTTADGESYLDFTAGIAVLSTGHCHPHVVAAVQDQAARFMHAQVNVYRHNLLEPLAERLDSITPRSIDTFFFANSGAEITEAAVKLAKRATKRPHVITVDGSFHGRTHLAMAMTNSKTGYRSGYSPLPSGIFTTPFPDPHAVDDEAAVAFALAQLDRLFRTQTAPEDTACIIVEPVLGEGGYIPAPAAFIQGIVERCKQHGVLFIADEVQTGFGRTGRWFAVDHHDVEPDIMCMAKGIASGFPFAALGTRRELDDAWPVGSHGGTYGGNPVGCAAALATMDVIGEDGFLDNVVDSARTLRSGLDDVHARHPEIRQVRGLGLMVGVEFDDPNRVNAVLAHCRERGELLLMSAGPSGEVVRFMPPLTVTREEISEAVQAFTIAVDET